MKHQDAFMRNKRKKKQLKPDSLKKYVRDFKRMEKALPDTAIDQITVTQIDEIEEEFLEELAPKTVNDIIGSWREFAKWQRIRGYIPKDRISWVDDMERIPETRKPRACMSLPALVAAIRKIEKRAKHVSIVLWAMFITGARPKALVEAKWRDVHMPKRGLPGMIVLGQLKGGLPATSSIFPDTLLEKILDEAREMYREFHKSHDESRGRFATKKTPVFPTTFGRSKINPGGWTSDTFSAAVRYYSKGQFTAYKIRHSACTWLQMQGANAHQIKAYARHRNLRTQEVYIHDSGMEAIAAQNMIEKAIEDVDKEE